VTGREPPRRRLLLFGLACLTLGWIAAGELEFIGAAFWKGTLVLLVLVLTVAAVSDRV
jgi:hypothetical protein